jgi:spore maturation protein A
MNLIWGIMLLSGLAAGILTGQAQAISDALLSSAREAVTLCITMLGVTALWTGLMEIAKEAGLIRRICRSLQPLVRFLFPYIPEGHPAGEHITMNFTANLLGLGWAATPAGLKAMESLERLEQERRAQASHPSPVTGAHQAERRIVPAPPGTASNEMCTFLILNISSLQLIPVNIIAYRSQYGSADPTAITGPGIAATAVSTAVAIVFCRIVDRKYKK